MEDKPVEHVFGKRPNYNASQEQQGLCSTGDVRGAG